MTESLEKTRKKIHMVIAGVILAGGLVICISLIFTKPVPAFRSVINRILEVATRDIQPQQESTPIVGHGTVRPKNQVNIVPQVSGKLNFAHPHLAQGKIIPKGELLFEIDQTVYESRLKQAEANIRGLEASLALDDQEMKNLDLRIANAQQMLEIDNRDYLTSKQLYEVEEVGTRRDVDLVQKKYLQQLDAVTQLKNRRASLPHSKMQKQAELDSARAKLKQTQHDLKHTKIFCPFKARVESVLAHTSQVVTAHFSIAKLTDMEAFEISVGIDPRDLRWLDASVRPEALEATELKNSPSVKVSWTLQGQDYSWKGLVTRFERVDELTRTARMIIEIRDVDMVATVTQGATEKGPTLSIGMFCKAELPAQVLLDALLVPRHAIYDNQWVYIFETDDQSTGNRVGRLARREVPMLRTIGDAVLVDYRDREGTEICTLTAGDRVVVSPLLSPVVGMKIRMREKNIATAFIEPVHTQKQSSLWVDVVTHAAVLSQIPLPRGGD